MSVELSIIIINYNSNQFLNKCVKSVFEAYEDIEVIVVDNASSDSSLSLLISIFPDEPKLHIIRNSSNLGFAKACNIGTQSASGKYLLYLNPDTVLQQDAISNMLRTIREDPKIGMVGGMLVDPDGNEQAGGRRSVPTPWRSFVRAFGLSKLKNRYPRLFSDFLLNTEPVPDTPIEVEAISGACMLVRREAFEDVGPLDEDYFLHCEDLDWCMRFRQNGWKIVFIPNAKVIHYKGICSKLSPIRVEWYKHKGMVHFYKKFFQHQYPGIFMWFVYFGVWLHFGIKVILLYGSRLAKQFRYPHG